MTRFEDNVYHLSVFSPLGCSLYLILLILVKEILTWPSLNSLVLCVHVSPLDFIPGVGDGTGKGHEEGMRGLGYPSSQTLNKVSQLLP